MTRRGWFFTTYFAALGMSLSMALHPVPRLIWNATASVPNRLIDRSMDVQPTLTDRPGLPFTLIVNRDLVLKPWHPHEGAAP